jgi:hypothetical protein
MKIIPLIHIKQNKIVNSDFNKLENIKNLIDKYEDDTIYLLDHDGINKNRPNICLFKKLSKKHNLWIDTGPRVIGDIVDTVIAGASKITIRKDLLNNVNTSTINEILENEIYMKIDPDFYQYTNDHILKINFNGYVILNDEKKFNYDFKDQSYIKKIIKNTKTYFYIKNKELIRFTNKFNFEGFLIDIEKIKEFENIGI